MKTDTLAKQKRFNRSFNEPIPPREKPYWKSRYKSSLTGLHPFEELAVILGTSIALSLAVTLV